MSYSMEPAPHPIQPYQDEQAEHIPPSTGHQNAAPSTVPASHQYTGAHYQNGPSFSATPQTTYSSYSNTSATSYPPAPNSHYAPPTTTGYLPPSTAQYPSAHTSYPPYNSNFYPTAQPQSNALVPMSQPYPAPLPAMNTQAPAGQQHQPHVFDTTGQVAPPGMKPRVTATLWEDEGSLCFQVEAKGVCVARREDNHMINGTKLLNVAGMTRGRRDGILKSEKVRHVVKIGPMHLKGVWIQFERALEFANKEKITEALYPLFVHDIGSLLYHPANPTRQSHPNGMLARRADPTQTSRYITGATTTLPPSLHHHSISAPSASQPPHLLPPHPTASRPAILDRAHTFPTPPNSGGVSVGMSGSEWSGSYQQNMPALAVDTGLPHARSVPTTPASTPPVPGLPAAYDATGSMYSNMPPSQPVTFRNNQQLIDYRHQDSPGSRNEMAPPSRAGEPEDAKPVEATQAPVADQGGQENDNEYTTSSAYNGNRVAYPYGSTASSTHVVEEITDSPRQNASGRQTPRTNAAHTQWNGSYSSTQRPSSSSNVYNVMADSRGPNSNGNIENYPSQTYANSNGMSNAVNGASTTMKRGHEEEHDDASVDTMDGMAKRRRTLEGGAVGGTAYRDASQQLRREQRNMYPATQARR
ncbi:apses-domain-containing protein [Westerdykella ornata]|uniref:Apses-domain-containing protein n=1 Tax=Westerdykella ornata TaxID=318751 RepID=A0A6A6J9A0_WESOR|nr:apses-domain-containing protein [Westerdykella ornata]KAF2272216.1 apses-domain-containing protein [Westerdykella ornata]